MIDSFVGMLFGVPNSRLARPGREFLCAGHTMEVRLINKTDKPIEITDGLGGYMTLQPGVPTDYPGEIAGADLRRLIREQKVVIEDEPPGLPPVD